MKNSAYYNSKIKHQLKAKADRMLKNQLKGRRERKINSVVWKLNQEQLEFVKHLGYYVEEYLYQIKTKQFKNLHAIKSTLLKDIHFKNKKGTKTMVKRLEDDEKKLLDEYGIKYRPYKFKIYLNY